VKYGLKDTAELAKAAHDFECAMRQRRNSHRTDHRSLADDIKLWIKYAYEEKEIEEEEK